METNFSQAPSQSSFWDSSVKIHPTSVVDSQAQLDSGVSIGPFCMIGPNVKIGKDSRIISHVYMEGDVSIGERNTIYPFCSIGTPPQDLSYKGEPTKVEMGNDNVLREYVSIHRGSLKQNSVTIIGDKCLLMAYVHLGHDVVVGNNVIIVNASNLAGHVTLGDRCIIGGGTNIAQFVTLGKAAYIGGGSAIDRDIPPFCTAYGNRVKLKGVNIVGLKRLGYTKPNISEVVEFYRAMESSGLSPRGFIDHGENVEDYKNNEVIQQMIYFIKNSDVGIAPFLN
jgi:UDP-N-acetylglucosamine acyltransferase